MLANYSGTSLILISQSIRSRLSTGYSNIHKFSSRSLKNYNMFYLNNINYGIRSRLVTGYTVNNYKNGTRSIINNTSNNLLNPIESIRSVRNYNSDSFIKIGQSLKNITNKFGYTIKGVNGIRSKLNNYGYCYNDINVMSRNAQNNVCYNIDNLSTNNISIDDIKLILSQTKTFANSIITVSSINKNILGKYHLLINKVEIMNYQLSDIDISTISFDIDNSKFTIGDNICKLEYKYQTGKSSYIQFKIVKEAGDRILTVENIYAYGGDYKTTGNLEIIGADVDVYKRSVVANGLSTVNESGWYEYIEDLTNELGIANITPDCSTTGVLFLISFDNKTTYFSFKNSVWSTVNISDIETVGMTKAELIAITETQWRLVFKRTKLTIIASLDYKRVNTEVCVSSFSVYIGGQYWYTYYFPTADEYIFTRVVTGGQYAGMMTLFVYDKNGNVLLSVSQQDGQTLYFNSSNKLLPSYYTVGCYSAHSWGNGNGSIYAIRRNVKLNSISITLPQNYAPALSNITLDSTTTHSSAVLNMHIKDSEGDIAYYKVDVNGKELIPYTTQNLSEYDIILQIPSSYTSVGTNAINITTTDLLRTSDVQTIYLTKTDKAPTILTSLFNYGVLNTVISDDDNDSISYRLTLNGNVKVDWKELELGPISIDYECNINDIIIGKQNTLLIEAKDSLGVISSSEIDFIGSYFGLLFQDSNNNSYSNNLGKIIKKLDFGIIVSGNTTQVKDIEIVNNTINDLQNLEINNAISGSGYNIDLSDSNNPFTPQNSINFSQLNSGTSKTIYARVDSKKDTTGQKTININVSGDKK